MWIKCISKILCQMCLPGFPTFFTQISKYLTSHFQAQKNNTPKKMSIIIKHQNLSHTPKTWGGCLMMWRHAAAFWTFSGLVAVAQPGVAFFLMVFVRSKVAFFLGGMMMIWVYIYIYMPRTQLTSFLGDYHSVFMGQIFHNIDI